MYLPLTPLSNCSVNGAGASASVAVCEASVFGFSGGVTRLVDARDEDFVVEVFPEGLDGVLYRTPATAEPINEHEHNITTSAMMIVRFFSIVELPCYLTNVLEKKLVRILTALIKRTSFFFI